MMIVLVTGEINKDFVEGKRMSKVGQPPAGYRIKPRCGPKF